MIRLAFSSIRVSPGVANDSFAVSPNASCVIKPPTATRALTVYLHRLIGRLHVQSERDHAINVKELYASVTIPLQNCVPLLVSTSYLRTKVSLPSRPMR